MFGHSMITRTISTRNRFKFEDFIPSLSVITEQKPDVLQITYTDTVNTEDIKLLFYSVHYIQQNKLPEEQLLFNTEEAMITDAYTYSQNNNSNFKFLSGTNSEKCAYFVRNLDSSGKSFDEDNLIIGYINPIDVSLINTIMISMKDKTPTYTLKHIKLDNKLENLNSHLFTKNDIDVLFIFESLESNVVTRRFDINTKLEVWDYADKIDIHKIKVQIPFVRKQNIDFSLHFPQLKGKLDTISSVFVIDVVVIVNEKVLKTKNVEKEMNDIIHYFKKPELINLYNQYFNIAGISKKYADEKNIFFEKRNTLQILEQFSAENKEDNENISGFVFDIPENINGFYDSLQKLFYIYSNMIYGIPLKENSLFKLSNQIRNEQNGLYRVYSVGKKQSLLIRLDQDNEQENKNNEVGYSCYNNSDITSKSACESLYDGMGQLKRKKTYWDKPCEKHSDCPFFQQNKNYKNYRGGCIDGRCEFPIGIKAVSYRLYDKSSKPVCHNCKDSKTNPYCCKEQEDVKQYPNILSPDYAFELDSFERLYAKTL